MQEQHWTEPTMDVVGSVDSSPGRFRVPSCLRILAESSRPLRLEEILEFSGETSRNKVQKQLDHWHAQNLVETIWLNGEMHYRARRREDDPFRPGSTFRLAVVRDRGRIAFAAKPLRFERDAPIHDRLLIVFCIIALGTLLAVAFFLFIG